MSSVGVHAAIQIYSLEISTQQDSSRRGFIDAAFVWQVIMRQDRCCTQSCKKWCLEKPSSLQNICVFTWILNNGLRMSARFGWHRTGSLRASCLCCQLFIMFIRCVGRFLTGNYTKQRLVYTLQLSKVPLKKYFEIHKERLHVFIVDTITLHHTTVWWAFIFMISQIHLEHCFSE